MTTKSQSGITLVELAVVIFLMLIVIIPMSYSIQRSLMTSREVYNLTTCALLAQGKMEEVRLGANCWTSRAAGKCPQSNTKSDFTFDFGSLACSFPAPFQDFQCQVLNNYPSNGVVFLRELQVRVWYDSTPNGTFDSGETNVMFQTTYSYHAPAWR